jgi:hypothetical protein
MFRLSPALPLTGVKAPELGESAFSPPVRRGCRSGSRAAQELFGVAGEPFSRANQEDAVFTERPFLRSMQVIDVDFIDGEAESGDVLGDALGAEQYIAGDALYRLIIVVERWSTIMPPRGLTLTLILAAAFARGLAGSGGDDGGVGRPSCPGVGTLIMIVLIAVHRENSSELSR